MSALNYRYVLTQLTGEFTTIKKAHNLYFYLKLDQTHSLLESQLGDSKIPASYTVQLQEICSNILNGIKLLIEGSIYHLEAEDTDRLRNHRMLLESGIIRKENLDYILLSIVNMLRKYRMD